jgi:hypothetical protein
LRFGVTTTGELRVHWEHVAVPLASGTWLVALILETERFGKKVSENH